MTSNQPYLLRAFFEWIVDNNLTPYIVVDATKEHVDVPQEFVKDGQIVLNISPSACVNFSLDNDLLAFQARFGGQPRRLSMPCHAILAIYARENGAGTVFASEDELSSPAESEATPPVQDADKATVETQKKPPKKGKPTLKVIK
ncbi:ClpXP protease specificity-enhancing factor [Alteromonas ponticola]|uniref:ClpXP protease specificity-enhancing factor n=1 Tax=Alteromonas ponticola TaxID=2720613 RepID=A0ABX1R3T7_9ALTE|nr:ClpXP protease specificity-enhancing factor [Alteromonas ponticola]NMH60443.1 ClpXP protease specificity-enhancing factor [Alteromonas ponticola]